MTIKAYIWWCGDEVCDCTQPVIEDVTPGNRMGTVSREELWRGSFLSGGSESGREAQQRELEAELMARGFLTASDTP